MAKCKMQDSTKTIESSRRDHPEQPFVGAFAIALASFRAIALQSLDAGLSDGFDATVADTFDPAEATKGVGIDDVDDVGLACGSPSISAIPLCVSTPCE